MPVDGLVLHALLREIEPRLRNWRATKIFQPWSNGVLIRLRGAEGDIRLVLSADASLPACHITTLQPENPLQAPVFAMVLRKHLEPARLLRIEQLGLDRVVHFVFEVHEEGGGRGERILALELLGQRSNLILIDELADTIIDALRRHKDPRSCDILPGVPYEAPAPMSENGDPLAVDTEELLRRLRLAAAPTKLRKLLIDHCDGIGAFTANELLRRAGMDPEAIRGDVDRDQLQHLVTTVQQLFDAARSQRNCADCLCGQARPGLLAVPLRLMPPMQRPSPASTTLLTTCSALCRNDVNSISCSTELLRIVRRHQATSCPEIASSPTGAAQGAKRRAAAPLGRFAHGESLPIASRCNGSRRV